jgi:hypothetical protein
LLQFSPRRRSLYYRSSNIQELSPAIWRTDIDAFGAFGSGGEAFFHPRPKMGQNDFLYSINGLDYEPSALHTPDRTLHLGSIDHPVWAAL